MDSDGDKNALQVAKLTNGDVNSKCVDLSDDNTEPLTWENIPVKSDITEFVDPPNKPASLEKVHESNCSPPKSSVQEEHNVVKDDAIAAENILYGIEGIFDAMNQYYDKDSPFLSTGKLDVEMLKKRLSEDYTG